jgi:DnaK suppressor protein
VAKTTPAKATAKAAPSKVTPAKAATKTSTGKPAPSRVAAKAAPAKVPAKAAPAKSAVAAPAKTAPTKAPPVPKPAAKPKPLRAAFLNSQRQLLLAERATYVQSAELLKAQADSLALEHEPGDVQFDEEGGEGGTATVEREMDLHLSLQARSTVMEIDRALSKIDEGTYGYCEQCGQLIPEPRLEALPHAALCVSCKSGGLLSRR